jgi:hypothetical protein
MQTFNTENPLGTWTEEQQGGMQTYKNMTMKSSTYQEK